VDSTIRSPPFPWFQPVPKQLNPLHDQQTLGLSMPKPYPRPMCQAARFWRDKCAVCTWGGPNVQDARSKVTQNFAQKTTIA